MADGPLRKAMRHIHQLVGATPHDALTDRQLIERFGQRRDEAAFAALVERHGPLVQGVCRRILRHEQDAEDAFQATFCVLARRAGSVGWHDSVANWLYEAALRVAYKARSGAARRQVHERPTAAVEPAATPQDAWHELKPLLDEELARLPRKLREPLVLCYLEGKTRDEAAQELGWSLGTLKGRLERGRDMLRNRLEKRGLALSAALFGSVLAEGTAGAAVPARLLTTTVHLVATGEKSPAVAALVQETLRAMSWHKLNVVALTLTLMGTIAGGLVLAIRGGPPPEQSPVLDASVPRTQPAERELALPERVRGQKILLAVAVRGEGEHAKRLRKDFDDALQAAGLQIVEQVTPRLLLLDSGRQKPADTIKHLPVDKGLPASAHQEGAIVFQDGQFREAIPYLNPINPDHKPRLRVPEPLARVWFHKDRHARTDAAKKFAAEGLHVEEGADREGNFWLQLKPGKDQTLLEVFLLCRAGFTFLEKNPHE